MFSVSIRVDHLVITGLNALDFRRRMKLADGSRVTMRTHSTLYVPVTEAFARVFFDRDSSGDCVVVPHRLLVPGDLIDGNTQYASQANAEDGAVSLATGLDPRRVMDLYVDARFEAEREKVRVLEVQVGNHRQAIDGLTKQLAEFDAAAAYASAEKALGL